MLLGVTRHTSSKAGQAAYRRCTNSRAWACTAHWSHTLPRALREQQAPVQGNAATCFPEYSVPGACPHRSTLPLSMPHAQLPPSPTPLGVAPHPLQRRRAGRGRVQRLPAAALRRPAAQGVVPRVPAHLHGGAWGAGAWGAGDWGLGPGAWGRGTRREASCGTRYCTLDVGAVLPPKTSLTCTCGLPADRAQNRRAS